MSCVNKWCIKKTKDDNAKVAHVALSRTDSILDDGDKVNCEKVQTTSDGQKTHILDKM